MRGPTGLTRGPQCRKDPMNAPHVPENQLFDLLRYRCTDPLDDVLQEYGDYIGQPREQVRAEYDRLLRTSVEEVGPHVQILPVLVSAIQLKHILERLQVMVGMAITTRATSFMDLGAGVGRDCIAFARLGIATTHADVPWPGVDFARWRYEQRGLTVRIVDARDIPGERYSIVGCHDVVEHVEDPIELMVRFVAHLTPGGFCFASFDLFNPIPTHLPKNDFYATFYDALLKNLGMELALGNLNPVQDVAVARMRVYQRTRPVRGAFAEELANIRNEAYAFAFERLGNLRSLLVSEHHRVAEIHRVLALAA